MSPSLIQSPSSCLTRVSLVSLCRCRMDFPMYVYKPRRGMKRGEESKVCIIIIIIIISFDFLLLFLAKLNNRQKLVSLY